MQIVVISGLFLRDGHWFDLQTFLWEQFAPSPDPKTHSLFAFRGKPTVFGGRFDDDFCRERKCDARDVWQYQESSDQWVLLGQMREERSFHHVVEIPHSFCQKLLDS